MVEDVGCNYISNSSPTRHPKRETNNTEAVKGMNIEILPPKRDRQIFRPTHHFQKHSPRRARPSHEMHVGNSCRQGLTSPKIPTKGQNQTPPATATPSLFHAIRYVDDDGRVEEHTLDNTTTDDEEDHTDVQKNQENVSQPHTLQTSTISPTANATTPTASRRKTRLSTATSTSTGKRKAAATSTATSPSPVRHHATNQMTKTAQVVWATSKNGCQAPRRTPGNIHLQLETSDINQAERVSEAMKTSNDMGRRHQRILTTNQSLQRQQRSHERSDLARHGARWLEWDSVENRVCEQQTQTTNTSHDRHLHDNDNQTNSTRTHNAHD